VIEIALYLYAAYHDLVHLGVSGQALLSVDGVDQQRHVRQVLAPTQQLKALIAQM
jgi:hypothetical protein